MGIHKLSFVVILVVGLWGCLSAAPSSENYVERLRGMSAEDYFLDHRYVTIAEAIEAGDASRIRLEAGNLSDLDAPGKEGLTLLMWSILKSSKTGMESLLKLGANPNVVTVKHSAMRMAAIMQDSFYLRTLIAHGGNVNQEDEKTGRTLIFDAALNRRFENIKALIKAGANIDHVNIAGNTVLNDTISAKAYEVSLFLLESGADPNIVNRWGYSASQIVEKYGDKGIRKGSDNYRNYLRLRERLRVLKRKR